MDKLMEIRLACDKLPYNTANDYERAYSYLIEDALRREEVFLEYYLW